MLPTNDSPRESLVKTDLFKIFHPCNGLTDFFESKRSIGCIKDHETNLISMKYIAKLTVVLTTYIALVILIPAINAQQLPPSSSAVASPMPGSAAESSASARKSVSQQASVASVPKQNAADKPLSNRDLLLVLGLLLPTMLGSLGLYAMVIVIVKLFVAAREREWKLTHEKIRLMIENGLPVPPELFLKIVKPRNHLISGVVLIAVGVGFVLSFGWWIPLLLGIGYFVWKTQVAEKEV